MADDREDDDDEDQTKQAGQSNVEGAGQADLQVKHELVGAVKLSQYDVPQQSKHVLFTEKFPKNSKAADADYLRNDTADYQKWLEEVMTFSGSYREGFVLMIMFFVVTLRSTTSRSEVALKQLQIKLDDLWDIWKVALPL